MHAETANDQTSVTLIWTLIKLVFLSSFIFTVLEDLQNVKKYQNGIKGISNSIQHISVQHLFHFIMFCFVVIWNEKCLKGLKYFKNKQLNAHMHAYVSLK